MNLEAARGRCWVEIDLDALEANYDDACLLCGGARIIPGLKANAYGLGAAALSRVLTKKGAGMFAVAEYHEAVEVRSACGGDVLVLGLLPEPLLPDAIRQGLIITVFSEATARAASRAAEAAGRPARVHIKLDTGLHRLGFDAPRAIDAIDAVFDLPGLRVEGVYTHLALRVKEADMEQFARFDAVITALIARGRQPGLLHACDSIGMVRYPGRQRGREDTSGAGDAADPAAAPFPMDAVRTGAWLYGVPPSRNPWPGRCRPVARLAARIAQLRDVAAGDYLGYDEEHPLAEPRRVATLSAGYADGFPRLSSVGWVEIRGRRAPVLGLVCMDQFMVDVTGIPGAAEGDEATLLGGGIDVDTLAAWGHANHNEVLSRIGRRVPRIYLRAGKPVAIAGPGDPLEG